MRSSTPRRTLGSADDGVIPLINVVFLLLVFFMVAGTVRPSDPIDTQPPESTRNGGMPTASRVLHLDEDGTLVLDDEPLVLADLAQALALSGVLDVPGAAVGNALSGDGETGSETGEGDAPLALRADASVSFSLLRETIDAIREAGVQRVELITDPAAEDAGPPAVPASAS